MAYKIQIFHGESGFYLNTNHISDDLEELKQRIEGSAFAGARIRIVDDSGTVQFGPIVRPRSAPMSVQDIASILNVPVRPAADLLKRRKPDDA